MKQLLLPLRKWGSIFSGVLFFCLLATGANAHRFHHSLGEVEVNSERKVLEIALKVIPEDLETALQEQVGKRINLEKSKGIDAEITRYLASKLQFVGTDQQSLKLVWVGKEVTHKAAWLYVEVPYKSPQTVEIQNTLLDGVSHGQQVNALVITQGDSQQRLIFGDGTYRHKVEIK